MQPLKEILSVTIFQQTVNKSGTLVLLQLRFSELIKTLPMFSSVRSHVLHEKLCFNRKAIELVYCPATFSHLSIYCLKGLYRDCFCFTVKFGQKTKWISERLFWTKPKIYMVNNELCKILNRNHRIQNKPKLLYFLVTSMNANFITNTLKLIIRGIICSFHSNRMKVKF